MTRRLSKLFLILSAFTLLTGCWDYKDIQDIHYVTTLGVDYLDGKYEVYVQLVDLSGVAKQENKSTEPGKVYVGKHSGKSIAEAINHLYQSAQQRLYLGQVSTFVLTDRALKHNINDIIDAAFRYNLIRYSSNIFATNKPLEELFAIKGFFNLTPLYSELHFPKAVYENISYIKPISLRTFISTYRDVSITTILPTISFSEKDWTEDKKKRRTFMIDGAFVLYYKKSLNWYSIDDLKGLRWVTEDTNRTPLEFKKGDGTNYISLSHPKVKIKPFIKDNEAKYNLDIHINGSILEMSNTEPLKNFENVVQDYIRKEIEKTYKIGLKRNGDPLGLGRTLYRKELKFWQAKGFKEPNDYLKGNSIDQINITVNLTNAGTLDYHPFKSSKLPGNDGQ
ncbi:Ger(x)C family spore germination protein [Peribacillus sp. NPDC097264]|uniref:Ger(x)C family spore germination protein n=1 Tax=Peribacillus sp. NPDC097264 TaxID=3390616 RepID=UPI003D076B95